MTTDIGRALFVYPMGKRGTPRELVRPVDAVEDVVDDAVEDVVDDAVENIVEDVVEDAVEDAVEDTSDNA